MKRRAGKKRHSVSLAKRRAIILKNYHQLRSRGYNKGDAMTAARKRAYKDYD